MLNEKDALDYIDGSIRHWRKIAKDEKHGFNDIAKYYIDAFQSVRNTLYGEYLARESLIE